VSLLILPLAEFLFVLIIEICEQMEIDPEDMAKIVKGPLKSKLQVEAMDRNIIKRTTSTLF